MKLLKSIFSIGILIFSLTGYTTLPKSEPIPGGIAIINLENLKQKPTVSYNKRSVFVMKNKESSNWIAIVGIPLTVKNKTQSILVNNKPFKFEVGNKNYPKEYLTIKNNKLVTPEKHDMDRITREYKSLRGALAQYNNSLYFEQLNFILPTQGRFSSPFGLKRYYNQQPRNPHSGLDIAAPAGQGVKAALTGKVILTGNFYFNGRTVVVDHGRGLKTLYCHLSEITAKDNQIIKQGDVIGKVGQSGRVTGPHLHWTVVLNDVKVDPQLFLTDD